MKIKSAELLGGALNHAVGMAKGVIGPDERFTDEFCDGLPHQIDGLFDEECFSRTAKAESAPI